MLERWTRRAMSAQALALRARIVLACAGPEVPPIVVVARELRVAADTVRKWRRRFLAERLDGLVDEPRPGRPPTISVDQVEAVVVTTLEQLPKNATHWSRTSMAQHSGLSKSTVGRIWRQFQLRPHLADTFKLSTDPLFVEKVYDVVGLYFNPPEGIPVEDGLRRAGHHRLADEISAPFRRLCESHGSRRTSTSSPAPVCATAPTRGPSAATSSSPKPTNSGGPIGPEVACDADGVPLDP